MRLVFRKRLKEEVEEKDFDDGRIPYRDLEIVPSHYEMHYAGNTFDVDTVNIVFKSKAKLENGKLMDVVVTCDNKAGMPITFKTVDEAKRYLEEYYDTLKLDVRDTSIGTEFHLVPSDNDEDYDIDKENFND